MTCNEDGKANPLVLAAYIGSMDTYEKLRKDPSLGYDEKQSIFYAIHGDEPLMFESLFGTVLNSDRSCILPEYTKKYMTFHEEMISQHKPNILQWLMNASIVEQHKRVPSMDVQQLWFY
eukprot:211606_1